MPMRNGVAPLLLLLSPFVLSNAQTQPNQTADMQLSNAKYAVLSGKRVPGTTTMQNGRSYDVPETCRFRYHVPAGSPALGWRQVGETIFHRDAADTCEGSFIQGEPPHAATAGMSALNSLNQCTGSGNYCRVSFTAPWRDPIYLDVAHGEAEVAWNYNQPCPNGTCARYISGSATPYGFPYTNWYQYARWGESALIEGVPSWNISGLYGSVGFTGSAIMANSSFPPCTAADPVYIRFDPTQVFGYPDGSFDGWASSTIYGGLCKNLLHQGTAYLTIQSQ
jgi:hypothetical protein